MAAVDGVLEVDVAGCGAGANRRTNGLEQNLIAEGDISAITWDSSAVIGTTSSGDGGLSQNNVSVVCVEDDVARITAVIDVVSGITTGTGDLTIDSDG